MELKPAEAPAPLLLPLLHSIFSISHPNLNSLRERARPRRQKCKRQPKKLFKVKLWKRNPDEGDEKMSITSVNYLLQKFAYFHLPPNYSRLVEEENGLKLRKMSERKLSLGWLGLSWTGRDNEIYGMGMGRKRSRFPPKWFKIWDEIRWVWMKSELIINYGPWKSI